MLKIIIIIIKALTMSEENFKKWEKEGGKERQDLVDRIMDTIIILIVCCWVVQGILLFTIAAFIGC